MSWEIGIAVLALVGIAVGASSVFISNSVARWCSLVLIPLLTPTTLYWGFKSPEGMWSEHWNWAPVFIVPWTLCCLGCAFTSFALFRYIRRRKVRDGARGDLNRSGKQSSP